MIQFPGDRFDGSIAPAIADLVDRGVVGILDLVFVKKGTDGSIVVFEYDELDEVVEFSVIDGEADGLLSSDDVVELAGDLPPGSAALFVLFEDLWAAELGRAVRAAGGELVAGGRIPHQIVTEAVAAIASANGEGGQQ